MSRLRHVVYLRAGIDRVTALLVVLAQDLRAALECPGEWDE